MAFLSALAKLGLVELSAEETAAAAKKTKKVPEMSMADIDKLIAQDAAETAAPTPRRTVAPPAAPAPAAPAARKTAPAAVEHPAPTPPPTTTQVQTGGSFDDLYASARVAASPFPAEKLLRLLDGLQTMDMVTRRVAVLAMDAADDTWTIGDPVLDAKRKIKVLADTKLRLDDQVQRAEEAMRNEIARLDAYQEQAKATIREKIAALQAQLDKELIELVGRRAGLQATFARDREAARAEHVRLDGETARLAVIPQHFESALKPNAG